MAQLREGEIVARAAIESREAETLEAKRVAEAEAAVLAKERARKEAEEEKEKQFRDDIEKEKAAILAAQATPLTEEAALGTDASKEEEFVESARSPLNATSDDGIVGDGLGDASPMSQILNDETVASETKADDTEGESADGDVAVQVTEGGDTAASTDETSEPPLKHFLESARRFRDNVTCSAPPSIGSSGARPCALQ